MVVFVARIRGYWGVENKGYCSPQQSSFIEHELAGDRDGKAAIKME